ncbi:MAG TPA: 2-dehydropantoate 2-reductase, partial [Solirubrobacteraceae bacterium]|nr:2-dehydropantoate 2-reductase [Solirubrobacteraceae bacterium]
MKVAVLGPGGVGGLLGGVLTRTGTDVVVVAREPTAAVIAERGISVRSVTFGEFVARPVAVPFLQEPVDALIVATKAAGLAGGVERIGVQPAVVLPLLNGLDHIDRLRERFRPDSVLAGSIRVEADRPEPGVVVHTSPFLLVSMAGGDALSRSPRDALALALADAGVPVSVLDSQA